MREIDAAALPRKSEPASPEPSTRRACPQRYVRRPCEYPPPNVAAHVMSTLFGFAVVGDALAPDPQSRP